MLLTKLTKSKLPLSLCLISALLAPIISHANTDMVVAVAETGSIAATKAADQKAALAKKAADRKKASQAQTATEAEKPVIEQQAPESTK
jgi:hypothetical protein